MKWKQVDKKTKILSGTLRSIYLSFRRAYSRSRSFKVKRSRKGQTDIFGFGQRNTCFGVSFSSRMRKMTLQQLLNGKNRKKLKIGKIIRKKQRENGLFRPSKHQNSVIFQDIYMKFCTHIHLAGFFHIYSGISKIQKSSQHFLKILFLLIIF